jgi:hypothetical protein
MRVIKLLHPIHIVQSKNRQWNLRLRGMGKTRGRKKIVTTSSFSFDRPSYILIKIVKWFTLAFGYYLLKKFIEGTLIN